MHIDIHLRRRGVMLVVGAIALLAVAGAAYAAIPDGNGVYTACRLNGVGTIRLIDPSGPSSSLLSRCTRFETQISWSQAGPKGETGAAGASGLNGVSPTVTPLSVGDSNCPAGGAAIKDAAGSTAYVCSGQNGQDGKPFAGTFTSPDGQFSLSVTNAGIELSSPGAKVSLPSGGGVEVLSNGSVSVKSDRIETVANDETVTVQGNRTETVGNNESVTINGSRTETVDHNDNVTVHGSRTETVGNDETITVQGNRTEKAGSLGLQATGALDFVGSLVGINGGSSSCRPVARVDDLIDPVAHVIETGSPTVCIG